MRKTTVLAAALGFAAAFGLYAAPAAAQAYVDARTGTDSGACPVTAPCATLNYALSQTAPNGSINVLGAGSFGPIKLTAPVNIIGPEPSGFLSINANPAVPVGCVGGAPGSCGANNGFGVEINGGVNDIFKFKNVLMGAGPSGSGALKINSGNVISMVKCVFRGNSTMTNPIVWIAPGGSAHTEVYMSQGDIAFNKNGGAVLVAASGTNNARLHFNHMEVHHATYGIRTDATGLSAGNSIATFVSDSEFFSFTVAAVTAFSTAGTGTVNAIYKQLNVLNAGGPALNANGPGSFVVLTESTLGGNQFGVKVQNGATVLTSVNNTIKGNGTDVSGSMTAAPLQ